MPSGRNNPKTTLGNLTTQGDWRSVEHLYEQFTTIVSKKQPIPAEIPGALANSMGRVVAAYEDMEPVYIRDLLELWSKIDRLRGSEQERFRKLYFDERLNKYQEYRFAPNADSRRRPRPFEAAVETCRRMFDLNKVRQALAGIESGAILGGSASYGRFYNVTGASRKFGSKASDIDLLLVLKEYDQLTNVADRLSQLKGLNNESLELFHERVGVFLKKLSKYRHCIFSHKINLWKNEDDPILVGKKIPSNYILSFHVFSLSDFDYLTLKNIPIIEPPSGISRLDLTLHDYRDTAPPSGRAYDSRSFAGIPLGKHSLDPVAVPRGFVAKVQMCLIEKGRYCPGLHQNLILPQFEKRWESNLVRLYLRLLAFRWKILERLRFEKTKRPFEEQSLSQSHVRSFVFSPHITRRADRG